MTIIRLSIWMVLIIALIPTSQGNQYSLYSIITSTAQDFGEFCSRRPDTCEQTSVAFYSLGEKAEYAGKAIYGLFEQQTIETAAIDKTLTPEENDKKLVEQPFEPEEQDYKVSSNRYQENSVSENTLESDDLASEWLPPDA